MPRTIVLTMVWRIVADMHLALPVCSGLLGLTKLRALSSLNLSDNNAVRDIGLENLTRLCSLKHLDLSYTGIALVILHTSCARPSHFILCPFVACRLYQTAHTVSIP